MAQIDDMTAEITILRHRLNTPHCMQCGYELQRGDPDLKAKMVTHIAENCPDHPFRKVIDDNVRLTRQRDIALAVLKAVDEPANYADGRPFYSLQKMVKEAIEACSR